MHQVVGVAQHYPWGDPHALPDLLGLPADGRPWAEWWLGTHPGAPAQLDDGRPLREVTGDLPYLVKYLAAAQPLSLQTHPNALRAAAGFADEDARGIPADHPRRRYRDPFAKPELIIALTRFVALCGFRPESASIELLREIGAEALADHLARHGLAATVTALYRGSLDPSSSVAACAASPRPEAILAARLATEYPGDPSAVVTLLLHRVELEPGEALYLTPGNLHAYVHGLGLEVMGPSDNVLRGGLTSKFVDVDELLRVMSTVEVADPRVTRDVLADDGGTITAYLTPGAPFSVRRFDVTVRRTLTAVGHDLVVCTSGDARLLHRGGCLCLAPGEVVDVDGPAVVWQVSPAV